MTTTAWHSQTDNGHYSANTSHEEAPTPLGSGGASSAPTDAKQTAKRATRKTGPAALDDPVVRNYLSELATAECARLEPSTLGGNAIERVNAALVIDKLTAAAGELKLKAS